MARHFATMILPALWTLAAPLSGELKAIPAPMSEARLTRMAQVVVEGQVVSSEYLSTKMVGRYRVHTYRSKLSITKVLKGPLKTGRSITIYWRTESWVGTGRRPVGRAPQPSYYPCSKVRAYLSGGKRGYSTVYYTGKKTLKRPVRYVSPTPRRKTIRCVRGNPK